MGIICTIRFCDDLSRWVQPPDAENRMSGGVGGITGAIPLSPPDHHTELAHATCATIRLKLFKVGAVVIRNTRRLKLLLSSSYPYQALFQSVCQKLCLD